MLRDLVTQTLLQSSLRMIIGVIILPITLYRLIALFVSDNENILVYYIILFVEIIVSILLFISSLFIKSFSRKREFKSDHLTAQLTTPENMILALKELDGPAKLLKSMQLYNLMGWEDYWIYFRLTLRLTDELNILRKFQLIDTII